MCDLHKIKENANENERGEGGENNPSTSRCAECPEVKFLRIKKPDIPQPDAPYGTEVARKYRSMFNR